MKYREIILNIPKEIAEDFTAFLDEIGVAGYYEILFDREKPRAPQEEIISDDTKFRVYLAQEDRENETKILIFLKANAGESLFFESRWIETKEYEEAYKEFYKPFIVGSYRVIPTWEKDTALGTTPEGIFPLLVNPGLAFGTGHHETTRLVLGRMGNLNLFGKKVADVGTGSGILSVAAARSGASSILAVDIDPNSVRSASFNRDENDIPSEILVVEEGGFDHEKIQEQTWDLLIANITFAVLKANIQKIASIKTDHFLFSGIITERREEFLKLLKDSVGGENVFSQEDAGWELIEWKRKG
ncbi:50S ribosomal protein L11 methyltransferase [Leptospira santarosai]|uniref:Ribosomal protein L11 methyltransferase n=1 Tax=Leptospira santarosai serovar Arenal str. MAVJ 401 TaxID=1049976 RepID=M6JMQ9_9LEPT|nr:50S ribosomal protein L11 methyltransferase [Leptospira santarosai]EMN23164.1 ribosomal protein L11 methyltransferase [Leptospira santarosai serovar Arenal str. MAVJ 401]MDI7224907.1 50S ribosomal protein L11 methyltransferase [Leptospira santarosai]OLY63573.1 ribosomal protein L11 methyltransferase [Leptospira santarosai serovar Grippotyphosa]ONF77056.1 ribosomal protein L11 methyltransferase [Leptospira santarosai serovar Bananal]UZN06592.1 50S ribosomal protein L11 methyltransferase [Lep